MEKVLEVSGLSKKFKRNRKVFYALDKISFNVKKGEVFAVLGPNGAGKSTLINIILGLLYQDSGDVKVLGKKIQDRGILKRTGYVCGQQRFHWALTAYDILSFGCAVKSVKKQTRIPELSETFGLKDVLRSSFDVLSTGERMRLGFAYAMIAKPDLLLLDEPTLGLDPDIAIRIREEIKKVNKELKTTVVLTSHYMKEVEQLSHRVVFINRGRIVDSGTVEEVRRDHPDLESYFLEMIERG